jgi:hypothetical protein
MGLTMKEKKALSQEVAKRYQQAGKKEKGQILNEFVENTGYNRKYALHLLANWGKTAIVKAPGMKPVRLKAAPVKRRKGGGRKPVYGEEAVEALRLLWEFFGYMCGKLLAPLLRQQIVYIADWQAFHITPEIREQLLTVSPSTIDRKLKEDRKRRLFKGISGTKPGKMLRGQIPVRTHYPWDERKPGFFEVDTVHHCGERAAGEYNLTLTAVDVFSGWVELFPLLNKAHKWTLECLSSLPELLPFPLLGIDSDNGEEFINKDTLAWCTQHNIQFTRSRPYKKNDNCFVEQKNDTCVRQYVSYRRYDTAAERDALAAVYRSLCPLLNYFLPTMKLIDKTRVGSAVRKVYEKEPKSPYQRLIESPDISDPVKVALACRYRSYNPVLLQQQVHQAINELITVYARKSLSASA